MNSSVGIIPFVKASACGNDFLLIDFSLAPPSAQIHAFTKRICDRHDGVGADGVEWMLPHPSADIEIRLINADGSEAEISGNGTRCVAAYLCSEQGKEKITIRGKERELLRLNLSGEDLQWNLWVDDNDHFKLIRVAIPADNTVVDRD